MKITKTKQNKNILYETRESHNRYKEITFCRKQIAYSFLPNIFS